jgi:excisionase family DNA binding protein
MEKLITVQELSKLLSVKTRTLYHWVREGVIPYVRLGKLVRFDLGQIEDWVMKGRQPEQPNRQEKNLPVGSLGDHTNGSIKR